MGLLAMDIRLRQIAELLTTLHDSTQFNPALIGAKLLPHLFVLDIERDTSSRPLQLRIRLEPEFLRAGNLAPAFKRKPSGARSMRGRCHGNKARRSEGTGSAISRTGR